MPILIGWCAAGGVVDLRALSLWMVLFLWQFPHFMAIAWLYRADYARVGHHTLTTIDPRGWLAGRQAVTAALLVIPVSLVPAVTPGGGSTLVYFTWAVLLGVAQLAIAVTFLVCRDDRSARWLLRATLVYLPSWMGLLLMVAV